MRASDEPVLLDLELPRVSGLEVLREVRAPPEFKHLPVVVPTSSDEERDRIQAYDNHVNSYVRKPVDYDHFVKASRQIGLYWTLVNLRPPNSA